MTDVPGVIIAGGLALRMGGGDKSLREVGGTTILNRVIARLRPQVTEIALNANGDPSRFAHLNLPVIADPLPEYPGPLAGVLAGLDWATTMGARQIVTVAADTPFFPETLVSDLCSEDSPLVLAATRDGDQVVRHPTFGLWPTSLRNDLREALREGIRKVVVWTDRHGGTTRVFPSSEGDPFFNINTPEDLIRAEALVS